MLFACVQMCIQHRQCCSRQVCQVCAAAQHPKVQSASHLWQVGAVACCKDVAWTVPIQPQMPVHLQGHMRGDAAQCLAEGAVTSRQLRSVVVGMQCASS